MSQIFRSKLANVSQDRKMESTGGGPSDNLISALPLNPGQDELLPETRKPRNNAREMATEATKAFAGGGASAA